MPGEGGGYVAGYLMLAGVAAIATLGAAFFRIPWCSPAGLGGSPSGALSATIAAPARPAHEGGLPRARDRDSRTSPRAADRGQPGGADLGRGAAAAHHDQPARPDGRPGPAALAHGSKKPTVRTRSPFRRSCASSASGRRWSAARSPWPPSASSSPPFWSSRSSSPRWSASTSPGWLSAFFILSLGSLIASLVEFIRDVQRLAEATALEVGEDWEKK